MSKKAKTVDADLMRQIKEMEDQKRVEAMNANPVSVVESGSTEPVISFDQWWMLINGKFKMKDWLKEIVAADFKARGLKMKETEKKYDDTLRIFGYKW